MCLNVSVVKLCLYVSECVCSKIIKELPGLVGSGTPCISTLSYKLQDFFGGEGGVEHKMCVLIFSTTFV